MIIDGKFIEENSIPLDRLMSGVVTTSSYNDDSEALNTRISKIENLEMDGGEALQTFNTTTVNHFSTLINDESTDSAPAHSIKLDTVTDAMLYSGLKDRLVYTDQNRTITAADTFTGGLTFTGTSTYTGSAANTNVINVTKGNIAAQTISAAGNIAGTTMALSDTGTALTTEGSALVKQNLTVNGTLTVKGTTTTVNSSTLTITDRLITVGNGGAVPASGTEAGMEVGINGYSDIKKPRLVYKGDGWYVRNHSTTNAAQTESKIVTEAYLTAQGYQTTANLEAQIKTALKKYIAMGTCNVNAEVTLPTTFAANIASTANTTDYYVFANPVLTSGSAASTNLGQIGEIQVYKLANKKFKILTTGTTSPGVAFSWIAINKAICS